VLRRLTELGAHAALQIARRPPKSSPTALTCRSCSCGVDRTVALLRVEVTTSREEPPPQLHKAVYYIMNARLRAIFHPPEAVSRHLALSFGASSLHVVHQDVEGSKSHCCGPWPGIIPHSQRSRRATGPGSPAAGSGRAAWWAKAPPRPSRVGSRRAAAPQTPSCAANPRAA
jgi:hypothetical protein